jgi:hypothetical protein
MNIKNNKNAKTLELLPAKAFPVGQFTFFISAMLGLIYGINK